jgi:adenine-specific DNA-methyltransferase
MKRILESAVAPVKIISFNNEGYLSREDMEQMIAQLHDGKSNTTIMEYDYRRYIGSQIGIYNPDGLKVGKVSHVHNKEFLYVVFCDNNVYVVPG